MKDEPHVQRRLAAFCSGQLGFDVAGAGLVPGLNLRTPRQAGCRGIPFSGKTNLRIGGDETTSACAAGPQRAALLDSRYTMSNIVGTK